MRPPVVNVMTGANGWSLFLAPVALSDEFRRLAGEAAQRGPALLAAASDVGLVVVHPTNPICDGLVAYKDVVDVYAEKVSEMGHLTRGRRVLHTPFVPGGRLVFLVGPGCPGAIVVATISPLALIREAS